MVPTHTIPSLSGIAIIIGSKTHKANAKTIPKAFGIAKEPSSPSRSEAETKQHYAVKLKITNTKHDKSRAFNKELS